MTTISNIPAALEWRVYKGDTAKLTMVIEDEEGKEVDLSDYTFTGDIKIQPSDTEPEQELLLVTNANILGIEIPDTQTLSRINYFDIQSEKDGIIWTILKGTIIAEQDVTE
jgi:hypothetical protein